MKKLLLLVVLGFSIASCSKKDDPETGTPLERLTGDGEKTWRLVGAEGGDAAGLEVNLMTIQSRCLEGNELTLRLDNTYTFEDKGTVCTTQDGQVVERVDAKWSFVESPLQIKLDKISILGRTLENAVIDLRDVKNSSFTAFIDNLPDNGMGLSKVTLKFDAAK